MSAANIRIDGGLHEPLYCKRCGGVIGVYEPLVVNDNFQLRVTSRAAEPWLPANGAYSHHGCLGIEAAADAA